MLLRFFAHTLRQRVPIIAPGLVGFVFFLAPAAGCSHVGTEDAGASSGASGTGGSATAPCNGHISSVLTGFEGPASWVQPANLDSTNCAYPPNQNVQATCAVVTAVDTWDETGKGSVGTVYVQDSASPTPLYAGIQLDRSSFSPSGTPVPGDLLEVTGTYEEYAGPTNGRFGMCETLPRITGTATFRSSGVVPTPVVIQASDLTSYDGARRYFNTLVTVRNVHIAADGRELAGSYRADVAVSSGSPWSIDDELFDVPHQYALHQGDTFTSVTGIVTYFYSVSLAPRSVADFQPASPPVDAGTDGG
jgi:hypothetical protein